jgi:hypothetical protein
MERAQAATRLAAIPLLGVCMLLGCAELGGPYAYFQAPRADDPWSPKISRWQQRERATVVGSTLFAAAPSTVAAGAAPPSTPTPAEDLRNKYLRFRAEHKRALARELTEWLQEQAKTHYVPDGVLDRWATLEETLLRNGDDCDGLELLGYHLLLDLGFRHNEVYRAIVLRPADGQHHMVTLWFEDAADPWVIDPTGAMTSGMPLMSQVRGWIPLKLFSETLEYSVRTSPTARSTALATPLP